MTSEPSFATYPSLQDRGIFISGGASGIGAVIVRALTRQGARVGFVDVDDAAAEKLMAQCEDAGARHAPRFQAVDVADIKAYTDVIGEFEKSLGGIEVLINNAANDERHSIDDVSLDYWRTRMAVNLDHQFFAAQTVAKPMKERGRGAIINMGSCAWRLGLDQMSAYVTAKAAIEGLTNGLARELGQSGIRVNCVIPGFIKTERQVQLWLTPELEKIIFDGQCLKELIEPEYVANLISFLASDDARMCSSGTYTVDGGWI